MRIVVGLGSNLGAREATLAMAVRLIDAGGLSVMRRSRIFETPPIGPPQPSFLNAAVLLETPLAPHAVLDRLQHIERDLGRVRDIRWGPRTIDLDMLWTDGPAVADDRLVVPHPRLMERAFALAPLLDVLPDAGPELRTALDALGRAPPTVTPAWAEARAAAGRLEISAGAHDRLDALCFALSAIQSGAPNGEVGEVSRVDTPGSVSSDSASSGSRADADRLFERSLEGLSGQRVAGPITLTARVNGPLTLRFCRGGVGTPVWGWVLDHLAVRERARVEVNVLLRNCAD